MCTLCAVYIAEVVRWYAILNVIVIPVPFPFFYLNFFSSIKTAHVALHGGCPVFMCPESVIDIFLFYGSTVQCRCPYIQNKPIATMLVT